MKKLLRRTLSIATFGKLGKDGTPCGYCPLYIFEEHEAGGIIRVREGKPICARCRILNGAMGSKIVGDKAKRDAQLKEAEERVQEKANAEARVIAEETQTATGTKRK